MKEEPLMTKNIQVIDDADNCSYSIYSVSEELFKLIFPAEGQDVEFIEDFFTREGNERASKLLKPVWGNRVDKILANGIHGTVFYGLESKRDYYPNKNENDLD